MSDLDELKLKYTEENPDKPSDDVETIAFHSTPRKPKPAPKAVGPKRAKAEPPRKAVPLTMGVPRGVPTPNEASAALWLAALALAVVLAATRAAAVVPFLAIAVILALGTLMHPVTAPVLHDMERRFGLTVVDVSAGGMSDSWIPRGDCARASFGSMDAAPRCSTGTAASCPHSPFPRGRWRPIDPFACSHHRGAGPTRKGVGPVPFRLRRPGRQSRFRAVFYFQSFPRDA